MATLVVEMTVAYQTSALVLEAEAKASSLLFIHRYRLSTASKQILNVFLMLQIAIDSKE